MIAISARGKKNGNFVIVGSNFTNGKDEAAMLDSDSFRLIESEGRKFEVGAYGYVPAGKDVLLQQITPACRGRVPSSSRPRPMLLTSPSRLEIRTCLWR